MCSIAYQDISEKEGGRVDALHSPQPGKSKAFLHFFDHHAEYPADSPKAGFGAAHSDEMPLVFQQFGLPGRPPANALDQTMSEIISTYWTNFAKIGDPNGAGLPNWPAYGNAKLQVMHFVAGAAKAGPVVNEEGLKALDSYFEWHRTDAASARSIPAGDRRAK